MAELVKVKYLGDEEYHAVHGDGPVPVEIHLTPDNRSGEVPAHIAESLKERHDFEVDGKRPPKAKKPAAAADEAEADTTDEE